MATNFLQKHAKKAILTLATVFLLCFVCIFAFACSENKEIQEETFSKVETDELTITNGNFEFGSADKDNGDFPVSTSGWTASTDNSAATSYVNSGVIDVTGESWNLLLDKLYNDNDYKYWALRTYFADDAILAGKDGTNVKEIEEYLEEFAKSILGESASTEEINALVKTKVLMRLQGNDATYTGTNFLTNPGSCQDATATDHKVYMLNNYQQYSSSLNYFNLGTAQQIKSSKTIDLVAGEYGVISVWIRTANLTSVNSNYGANIRLVNTISGVTQSEYQISNINTNNAWVKYNIFVQAADFSNTALTVVVGLGYGNGNANATKDYCEGTVFVDNVTYTKLNDYDAFVAELNKENVTVDASNTDMTGTNLISAINVASYTKDDTVKGTQVNPTAVGDKFYSYFDMTLESYINESGDTYFTALKHDVSASGNYDLGYNGITVSNADEGGSILGNRFSPTGSTNQLSVTTVNDDSCPVNGAEALQVTVNKASYNYEIKSNLFAIPAGHYMQISFYLNTKLSSLDRTGVSIYAYDVVSDAGTSAVYDASTDFTNLLFDSVKTESDEWDLYTVMLSNNFQDSSVRYFYLSFYVGPVNVATQTDSTYYPTGTVTVADLKYSTAIRQSEDEYGNDNDKYDIYYLFNSTTGATKASYGLHSGYAEDHTADTTADSYKFEVAPESLGAITNRPSNVNNYTGVNSASRYVSANNVNYIVNDPSVNKNGADQVITSAGLINSKYFAGDTYGMDAYAVSNGYTDLADMLGWTYNPQLTTNNVQPLMIYNSEPTTYGYFGNTINLEAQTSTKISVDVKVIGDAVAYVYLVDMGNTNKLSVLSQDFKSNAGVSKGQDVSNKLFIKIDSATCQKYGTSEGWVTVNFYLASGETALNYRVEMWNGSRDGLVQSAGAVFFDGITTSGEFTEGDIYSTESPLFSALVEGKITPDNVLKYTRELSTDEVEFNQSDERIKLGYDEVEYVARPVWCTDAGANGSGTFVYAIYNTIDPAEVDPWAQYETDDEETEESSSCAGWSAEAFWLNLASILLAVALLGAIIIVLIRYLRKRGVGKKKKEVKSHYAVHSRNVSIANKRKKAKEAEILANEEFAGYEDNAEITETAEETANENAETVSNDYVDDTERTFEEQKEEFVYGDVLEDFSDDVKTEEPKTNGDDDKKDE